MRKIRDDDAGVKRVFFESMKEIYLKYISETEAMLEINISSKHRRKIDVIFEGNGKGLDMRAVMKVMESAAVKEIIQLLTEAAIRFSTMEHEDSLTRVTTLPAV